MKCFLENVTTPYMMRVDADILLEPNTLKPMLKMLKDDPSIGELNVPYYPSKGHITTDATMWPTALAKSVVWTWNAQGCDCIHVAKQISQRGFKVIQHPYLMARHLKCFSL